MDDSMLIPTYVLETEEVADTVVKHNVKFTILMISLGIITIYEVAYFLANGEINMLKAGLSPANSSLVIFILGLSNLLSSYVRTKTKNIVQFKFYSDHLRINRLGIKRKGEATGREEAVIKYADILSCEYFTRTKKLMLVCSGVNYVYNDDGKENDGRGFVIEKVNFTEAELVIDTCLSENIDFKKEFEEHSPIVVVHNIG